jgi:dihydrofolate reductase
MSKIFVMNHMSLDGVMQGPGRADEDTRGGFTQGGWAEPRSNEEVAAATQKRVMEAGGMRLLLGHRSYADMLAYWNERGGPFKDGLNGSQKYVVSRSSKASLPWPNSTLVSGDIPKLIAELKSQDGPDLCIMGSSELIHLLFKRGLVDDLLLFIHPILLGAGLRLFPKDGEPETLELLSSTSTTTDIVISHYHLA